MLVIHEWWGLNDWVKEEPKNWRPKVTWRWPWICTAGKWPPIPAEAHELMRGLPQDRAIKDLKAAFDYLEARPDVKKRASA